MTQSSGGSRRENADCAFVRCLTIGSENLIQPGRNFAPSPASGGGLGWGCRHDSHCSSGESFPHPPRSSSAATSPASRRGEASPPRGIDRPASAGSRT